MTFTKDITAFSPAEAEVQDFDLVEAFLHAFDTAAQAIETITDEVEALVQYACA